MSKRVRRWLCKGLVATLGVALLTIISSTRAATPNEMIFYFMKSTPQTQTGLTEWSDHFGNGLLLHIPERVVFRPKFVSIVYDNRTLSGWLRSATSLFASSAVASQDSLVTIIDNRILISDIGAPLGNTLLHLEHHVKSADYQVTHDELFSVTMYTHAMLIAKRLPPHSPQGLVCDCLRQALLPSSDLGARQKKELKDLILAIRHELESRRCRG